MCSVALCTERSHLGGALTIMHASQSLRARPELTGDVDSALDLSSQKTLTCALDSSSRETLTCAPDIILTVAVLACMRRVAINAAMSHQRHQHHHESVKQTQRPGWDYRGVYARMKELIEPSFTVDHTSITVRLHASTAPLLRALSAIAGITALILRALGSACMPARSNPENAITIK